MPSNHDKLTVAWLRKSNMYSHPGRLLVKLRLGETPDHIPVALDVREGHCQHCHSTHIQSFDNALGNLVDHFDINRLHSSAQSLEDPGQRHLGFGEIEEITGISRTLKIQCNEDCDVSEIVDSLRQLSIVEEAYPDYMTVTPFLEEKEIDGLELRDAWNSRARVRATEALAYEPGDPAFTIAVVDTGVSDRHPELDGRTRSGIDTVQLADNAMTPGIRLVGDNSKIDADPMDNVGHGTSCAGIVSAFGQKIPPGLAGDSSLLPIRVLGSAVFPGKKIPVGIGAISNIDEGMIRAVNLGAKVINMSFGTPLSLLDDEDDYVPHSDVVEYALRHNCILVAASGNSGSEERYTPAALDGVIAVGSVDSEGRPSHFSTHGPHVDLCAPGERSSPQGWMAAICASQGLVLRHHLFLQPRLS